MQIRVGTFQDQAALGVHDLSFGKRDPEGHSVASEATADCKCAVQSGNVGRLNRISASDGDCRIRNEPTSCELLQGEGARRPRENQRTCRGYKKLESL